MPQSSRLWDVVEVRRKAGRYAIVQKGRASRVRGSDAHGTPKTAFLVDRSQARIACRVTQDLLVCSYTIFPLSFFFSLRCPHWTSTSFFLFEGSVHTSPPVCWLYSFERLFSRSNYSPHSAHMFVARIRICMALLGRRYLAKKSPHPHGIMAPTGRG